MTARQLMRMHYTPIPATDTDTLYVPKYRPLTEAEIRDGMAIVRRDLFNHFTMKYSIGGWKFPTDDDIEWSIPPKSRTVIGLARITRTD